MAVFPFFNTDTGDDDVLQLVQQIIGLCAPAVQHMTENLPTPMEILEQARDIKADSASGQADPAQESQGNKYAHVLPSLWFVVGQSEQVQGLLAASVARSTAKLYTRHVREWLAFCSGMELSPLKAGTAHILEFLSRIAFQSGANSAKIG